MSKALQETNDQALELWREGGQSPLGDDGEGITLLASGRIRAVVNGKRHELRRVKVGEFRRFNDHLHEIDVEEKARIVKAEEAAKENGGQPRVDSTDLLLSWFRMVFQTLAPPGLEDADDDLPLWMTNPTLPIAFIRHWREAPLARSVPR